jgi:arylsulfatase A-like enzyme
LPFRQLITRAALASTLTSIVLACGPAEDQLDDPTRLAKLDKHNDLSLVLVLIDTLRADRLSSYGYARQTSPHLDALAARGIRFADVQSQSSWTKASMASLWTGTYPNQTGVTRWSHALPEARVLPAELLRDAGFRTVGLWRNGWVAPQFGFDQGFDRYLRPAPRPPGVEVRHSNPSAARLPGTDLDLIASAAEFLHTVREERFFLYLHLMDVHQYVYDGSSDFGTSYSDVYDNSIHWVDRNLGLLLAKLDELELRERTLIVVASDHGEAFGEHGHEGHAQDLHRETVHVPLVVGLPFELGDPVVIEEPVENIDLWPTLLDVLGLPPLPEASGRSLWPLALAAAGAAPDQASATGTRVAQLDRYWGRRHQAPRPLATVQEGNYRLFELGDENHALYDWSRDPNEQRDMSAAHPEVVEHLRAQLEAVRTNGPMSMLQPKTVALSDLDLGQLRALGYMLRAPSPETSEGATEESISDSAARAAPSSGNGPEDNAASSKRRARAVSPNAREATPSR